MILIPLLKKSLQLIITMKEHNGMIVILNGASSAGKSSIVKTLQNQLEEPFLEAGIDKFIWMLPHRYLDRPLWDEVLGKANQAGQTGHQLVFGMHRAVEALSFIGMNVIMDHVLVENSWWDDCVKRFHDLPAFLIGVHCPLEVLEEREKNRKNRTVGQARLQFDIVHGKGVYDLVVDTSTQSPEQCANQIKDRISTGDPPEALKKLSELFQNH